MSSVITLTGGTAWSTMYSGFSTTPGWRATIIDDLENKYSDPTTGATSVGPLKRYRLDVFVGRASRTAANKTTTVNTSAAPDFTSMPNISFGSWTVGSGSGSQLNAATEGSITAWSNSSFSYTTWENGTTGNYKLGVIWTFEGYTTYGYEPPAETLLNGIWKVPANASLNSLFETPNGSIAESEAILVEYFDADPSILEHTDDFVSYVTDNEINYAVCSNGVWYDGWSSPSISDPYVSGSTWVLDTWTSPQYLFVVFDPMFDYSEWTSEIRTAFVAAGATQVLAEYNP